MTAKTKNPAPLVSVVIPAYNAEKYIKEAVLSVLTQDHENVEVIVIDDASNDATNEILTNLQTSYKNLKIYRNKENLKIVKSLNVGISHSSGKYIARMDADDMRFKDSISQQVAFLEQNLDYVIVGGSIEVCDSTMNVLNTRTYPRTDAEVRKKIFRYSPFAHPAIMIRASALKDQGYELDWAEDYDLYFRLGRIGKMGNLQKTVLKLRTHNASISRSKTSYQEYLTLYIRLKAVFEYGYKMSFGDKFYFLAQLLSKFIMTAKFRFYLFNKLRSMKK